MKHITARKSLVSGLVAAGAVGTLFAGSALAAPAANLLEDVTYTVTGASGFCQSATPTTTPAADNVGTVSQSRDKKGHGPVDLSISGVDGYADDGFYKPVGTLGDLSGYTIKGQGDAFSTNLWFDTNATDDATTAYFAWSGDCLTGLGGDGYGLGPTSTPSGHDKQTLTVNDASTYFIIGGCSTDAGTVSNVTLAQLKAGTCAGIDASTPVAAWIGSNTSSGSLNTKITNAHLAH